MKLLIVLRCGCDTPQKATAAAWRRITAACAALSFGWDTYLYGSGQLARQATAGGLAGRVYLQPVPETDPQTIAGMLGAFVRGENYQGVIIADDSNAQEIAVLTGAVCQYACLGGVTGIQREKKTLLCQKSVYANNLLGQYALPLPFVISEKLHAAGLPVSEGKPHCLTLAPYEPAAPFPQYDTASQTAESMASPVLIVVGMGVCEKAEVERIRSFSRECGFSFGVTRPVAMRGWAGTNEIIGVSGSILSPKIAITLGVSGVAAFYAGIEQSEFILSVNTDPGANMAHLSDAFIADDYKHILEPLFSRLRVYRQIPRHE